MSDEDSDLPNLGLLIKLLKMTTSQVDSEALSAMRKANQQLIKFGGDWESLLRGKVTVVGDPFASGPEPIPEPPKQKTPPNAPRKTFASSPFGMSPPDDQDWDKHVQGSFSTKAPPRTQRFHPRHQPKAPPPKAPPPPPPPPKAPPGPIVFTKHFSNWVLKSPNVLAENTKVSVSKRGGKMADEMVGAFIEQDHNGYYLYRIGKANKWKQRYAGGPVSIDDLV